MGAVYKARHTRLNKIVAVKVLPSGRMNSPAAVARFEREMLAVGNLDHPNLIRAHDAGEVDGKHFLVMEYVDGADLSTIVKQQGPLAVADACEVIRQAALGLQSAHEHGLIHRDIKPGNLMLTQHGEVKVLDLGLALIQGQPDADAGAELTSMGQIMGTPDYMAPEQVGDSHQVDVRADIYSLGATLYKLLTGVAPLAGDGKAPLAKRLIALATEPHMPLARRRADAPAALSAVVDRMLAKRPEDRPATAAEVAQALAPLAAAADLPPLAGAAPGKDGTRSLTPTERHLASSHAETVPSTPPMVQPSRPSLVPKRHHRWAMYLGVAVAVMGFSTLLLLGIILLVPRSQGTLRIEINDPAIDVAVKGTDIVVSGADKRNEVRVSAGDQKLIVTCRDLKFETDAFTINKGATVALRVELLPGKVQVVRDDGQVFASQPLTETATAAAPAAATVDPPGATSVVIGQELLVNPGAESPPERRSIHGWKIVDGAWRQIPKHRDFPAPFEGRFYFQAMDSRKAELIQDVDVSQLAASIDAGKQPFRFAGHVRSFRQDPPDVALQVVEYRDASNQTVLGQFHSGPLRSVFLWREIVDTRFAPPGTRWIRVRLLSIKTNAESNDAYHDGLSLKAMAVAAP
jgi:serine/threonine protein kinase